jgi:peptide/nickel transport system substrate-binding protein
VWTIRLKQGVEFHNGKTLSADDAIFSIQRIIDPDNPKVGAAGLTDIDPQGFKKIDERTFLIRLNQPFAVFDEQLGQYFNGIVPVDYDPNNPVGTGPFRFGSFTPGGQSRFPANPNYWVEGEPHVDELVIIDFPDDTARVNALLSGQVQAIDNLPLGQLRVVEANPELKALVANTGAWLPFTMRVDHPPFDDVRVRQALRLIVDRQQMIDQALAGHGWVGNDLYSPFDPCYASDLPQREQDLEKAKALLKEAGHENLVVELVTSPVAAGVVEAAQVFAEQAKGAGVTVNLRKVDTGVFYGDDYLKWPFAQDFWFTRDYIPQVAQGTLPTAPYNETHWADPTFIKLIDKARGTLDANKRCELLHQAQQIEYESGGYIVWASATRWTRTARRSTASCRRRRERRSATTRSAKCTSCRIGRHELLCQGGSPGMERRRGCQPGLGAADPPGGQRRGMGLPYQVTRA